jgi:putative FmdB family regulatory protein
MPLYDYICNLCGPIREWGTITDASKSIICATCQSEARRVITAPNLALMADGKRAAHLRNERSAHEPRLMRREQLTGIPVGHLWHR